MKKGRIKKAELRSAEQLVLGMAARERRLLLRRLAKSDHSEIHPRHD